MKRFKKHILVFVLIGAFLTQFQSCKVGKDYTREEQDLPITYRQDFPKDSSISNIPWWKLFKDPVLVDLIDTALVNNKNIQIAIARIEESQLHLEISKAAFYPSVNYGIAGSSTVNSATSNFSNTVVPVLNVSYTVDLWQKIKSLNKIALQEYFATEEAYKALNISIISAVASAYISLRDFDNRLIIAEKTAKNFQDNLDVMQARFNAGFISEVDLSQAKIQLIEAKTAVEIFTRSRDQVENGISILLGSVPQEIPRGLVLYQQISLPNIPVGLPSELIERRPDIVEAERNLHAQTLRIGVAESLRYPSLTLNLNMGAELINPSLLFADLAGQILGPIFNGGKLKKGVEVEESRTKQLLLNYQSTYLVALQEVENAMIAVDTYRKEYDLRNEQMKLATRASQLSWVRYDGGLTSYLEVLDLQSSQFNAELKASDAFKQELISIIDLYKALGGGWYVGNNENNK